MIDPKLQEQFEHTLTMLRLTDSQRDSEDLAHLVKRHLPALLVEIRRLQESEQRLQEEVNTARSLHKECTEEILRLQEVEAAVRKSMEGHVIRDKCQCSNCNLCRLLKRMDEMRAELEGK